MTHSSTFYIFTAVFWSPYLAHVHAGYTAPTVRNVLLSDQISPPTNVQHSTSTGLQFEQLLSTVTKLLTKVETLSNAMNGLQNLAVKVAALEKTLTNLETKINKDETLNTSLEMVASKVDGIAKFVQYSHAFEPSVDGIIISYGSGFVTKALEPDGPQRTIKANENFALQHVAFDWNTRKVYFASTDDGIKRSNLDGTSLERLIPESARALAVDSLSGNFYYGNNQPGSTINVCDRNGRYCSVIAKEQTDLRDIALHPSKRFIFWSNGSSVVRANMDGTDSRIIVPQSASAIGVDEDAGQLYWGQSGNLIGSSDLNGNDQKVLISGISLLDGIAVYGQTVYYTDDTHGAFVGSINKNGSNQTVVPVSLPKSGRHIALYGKKPTMADKNPCESSPCAHVCVPKLGSYVCMCPERRIERLLQVAPSKL